MEKSVFVRKKNQLIYPKEWKKWNKYYVHNAVIG